MTAAQTKEHEDDTINIPGQINVVGGWCCCPHFFGAVTNNAGTQNACNRRQRSMAWKDKMRKIVLSYLMAPTNNPLTHQSIHTQPRFKVYSLTRIA